MTEYAQVKNGQVVSFGLPTIGEIDKRQVSNFHKLPQDVLRKAGWLPVRNTEPPAHDPETHEPVSEGWDISETEVTQKWAIAELVPQETVEPTGPQHGSLEDRIAELEAQIAQLTSENSPGGTPVQSSEEQTHDHKH